MINSRFCKRFITSLEIFFIESLLRDYLKRKTKEITGKSASGNKRNLFIIKVGLEARRKYIPVVLLLEICMDYISKEKRYGILKNHLEDSSVCFSVDLKFYLAPLSQVIILRNCYFILCCS